MRTPSALNRAWVAEYAQLAQGVQVWGLGWGAPSSPVRIERQARELGYREPPHARCAAGRR